MTQEQKNKIDFEKIIGNTRQVKILYELLKKREHNISHQNIPTLSEHKQFVINHPYRVWYLILVDEQYVGSMYLLKNNCLGLALLRNEEFLLNAIFNFIFKRHKPLKEIKSLRAPYFHINIAPTNKVMMSGLENIGAKKIQTTYSLDFN